MKITFENTYTKIYEEMSDSNRISARKTSKLILDKIQKREQLDSTEKQFYVKVENFIKRNFLQSKFTIIELLELCSSDSNESIIILCNFVKDVTKQNISEKTQIKVMSSNGVNIKKMSSNGKNSLRFSENNSNLTQIKSEGLTSRSFDYKILKKDGSVEYVLGKVCNHQGGHQNSVKDEIIKFLKSANEYILKNPKTSESFLALLDGNSFTDSDYKKFYDYTCGRIRVMSCNNYEE